jgi:hypothetical protein
MSKASTIGAVAIPRSDIFHRSTSSAGITCRLAIPTHTSLPSCSRPSRTSPPGGPKRGPSLIAAPRDGRTIVRAGTEEWLPRGRTKEWLDTGGQHAVKSDRLIPSSHLSTKPEQVQPPTLRRPMGSGSAGREAPMLVASPAGFTGCRRIWLDPSDQPRSPLLPHRRLDWSRADPDCLAQLAAKSSPVGRRDVRH